MSTTSVNPGVSDLLQTLSSLNSPVLSSSKVVAALENAPAADIVKLSEAAAQLQNVQTMFGMAGGTGASSDSEVQTLLGGSAANSPGSVFDLIG